MYKLVFFVPTKHKEKVKKAVFKAGAGKYKNYDFCCFESCGIGQFRPIKNANAYIGKRGKLEKVEEYRVECICKKTHIKKAIKALKKTHPYEEIAYDVCKLLNKF